MRASFLPKCAAFCALSALATATTTSLNVNPKALSPNLRIPVNPSGFTGPATGSNLGEVFEFETPGSMILNDPSIDGNGNIFLSLSFGYVYGINGQNGAQMWSYHSNDGSALGQAIVSTYGTVVVPTTKGAICLSATTGTLLWSFTDGLTMLLPSSIILTDPTDVSNAVFIAGRGSGATGSLYSYNGNTGAQNWMQPTNGATAAMDIGNGQVLIGYPGVYAQSALVIVTSHSASSGTQSWAQTLENNNNGIFTMVMFQMDNAGNVYVGYTSQTTGAITVSALSEQGNTIWTVQSTATNVFATIGFTNLYLATSAGTTAYALTTGNQAWSSTVGLSNLQIPVIACPGTYVYIVSGGLTTVQLVALATSTGNVRWTFSDPQARGVFGAPVFDAAGNIYIETFSSTAGSTVYCLNQHSGTIIWQFTVDPTATVYYDTGLTIGKGLIYHGDDLELVAIGPVSPSSNGGAIAGAVIGTLLGVGLIVAGVWYWKVKLGGTLPSFGRLNLGGGSSYKAIGGSTVGSGGTGAASSTGYSYTSSL